MENGKCPADLSVTRVRPRQAASNQRNPNPEPIGANQQKSRQGGREGVGMELFNNNKNNKLKDCFLHRFTFV